MINNVIFDVDGVLRTLVIEPVNEILPQEILSKFPNRYDGVSLRDYFSTFLHNKIFDQFDLGNMTRDEMARAISTAFDEPFEVLDYLLEHRLARDKSIIFEKTLDFVKQLRLSGVKTYILSNMGVDMAAALKKYLGKENFDDIIFSSEVHMMKPNPEIYEYAIKRFKIKPEESLFVDDRQVNLEPFARMGGNVFLFNTKDIDGSVAQLESLIGSGGLQKQ